MRVWVAALKTSAWLFGLGALLVIIMVLETVLDWGWTDAGNWGYGLMAIFIGGGTMIASALIALVSGIALLVLRKGREGTSES